MINFSQKRTLNNLKFYTLWGYVGYHRKLRAQHIFASAGSPPAVLLWLCNTTMSGPSGFRVLLVSSKPPNHRIVCTWAGRWMHLRNWRGRKPATLQSCCNIPCWGFISSSLHVNHCSLGKASNCLNSVLSEGFWWCLVRFLRFKKAPVRKQNILPPINCHMFRTVMHLSSKFSFVSYLSLVVCTQNNFDFAAENKSFKPWDKSSFDLGR